MSEQKPEQEQIPLNPPFSKGEVKQLFAEVGLLPHDSLFIA